MKEKKNANETNLVGDIEINDLVLVNNLNSIRLFRISVPSKLNFTEITLTKNPTQLIFPKFHSFFFTMQLLILLLSKVQYHHFYSSLKKMDEQLKHPFEQNVENQSKTTRFDLSFSLVTNESRGSAFHFSMCNA
jgi:hypothetical protein